MHRSPWKINKKSSCSWLLHPFVSRRTYFSSSDRKVPPQPEEEMKMLFVRTTKMMPISLSAGFEGSDSGRHHFPYCRYRIFFFEKNLSPSCLSLFQQPWEEEGGGKAIKQERREASLNFCTIGRRLLLLTGQAFISPWNEEETLFFFFFLFIVTKNNGHKFLIATKPYRFVSLEEKTSQFQKPWLWKSKLV